MQSRVFLLQGRQFFFQLIYFGVGCTQLHFQLLTGICHLLQSCFDFALLLLKSLQVLGQASFISFLFGLLRLQLIE